VPARGATASAQDGRAAQTQRGCGGSAAHALGHQTGFFQRAGIDAEVLRHCGAHRAARGASAPRPQRGA